MELLLGPLFVKAALPLVGVHFPASQCQSFKHSLVSKFRLGIWLLACTLGGCARVLARRPVLLIHRRLKCGGWSPAACLEASQDIAVYNRPEDNC